MRWIARLMLWTLAAQAAAQEWPKPTEEGQKDLNDLTVRCVASGGLKVTQGVPGVEPVRVALADVSKLRAEVKANPAALTPAVRDALVAYWPKEFEDQRPVIIALLRAMGEVTGDSRALAFAAFFEAKHEEKVGRLAQSSRLYNEAREKFATVGEPAWRATCYYNIGLVYSSQGMYAQALKSFQEALKIWREVYGDQHFGVATCYHKIGLVYAGQGEYAQALESYQTALTILRVVSGEGNPDVATYLNDIAVVYSEQGEYTRALEGYQGALEIYRAIYRGERHSDVAICYNNIASVYYRLEEYGRALEDYRKALLIYRAIPGDQRPGIALTHDNIGLFYAKTRDYPQALEEHQEALDIWRAIHPGERHPDVAICYNNIAFVHDSQGQYDQALESYQKALNILRAVYGKRHPAVAICYSNIAFVHARQGRCDRALDVYQKALDALCMGDDPIIPPDARRAGPRLRPQPLTVEVLQRRGKAGEQCLGLDPVAGLRECLRDYQEAADVLEQIRERILATSQSKLQLGEEFRELFPWTVGVASRLAVAEGTPDGRRVALIAAERGAARVFLEGLGRAHATVVGHVDAALRAAESSALARIRELDGLIDRAQALPFEKRDRAEVARLFDQRRQAEEQMKVLITRMEREYPQYAALKYPKACTIEQARGCLGVDEVALLYVLGSEVSYLIVLTKDDDPRTAGLAIHTLPPAGEIAELVSSLTRPKVLEDPDGARELGSRAFAMLLAPAADAIQGKGLVIVPSRALGRLPFELLVEPAKKTNRYLVQGHRIRYAPSLTALHFIQQWEQTRPEPERPLWALGDPAYGAAYRPLVASRKEIERLREVMGTKLDEVLVGSAATEAAVKTVSESGRLARYRYVHFATHGILGTANNTQPALVLSLVGDQKGEDGFFRLDEVTSLRLNADLVVLSACQTGQGKRYYAEGVSGLARAFLYAGSRGVLCSLWRVDDEATAALMADVYAELKAEVDPIV